MKNIIIHHDYKQEINSKDIEKFEKIISTTLCNDYKEFLLTYNGQRGYPAKDAFPLIHNNSIYNNISDIGEVKEFLSLQQLIFESEHSDECIPHELITIAHDSFGNRICLGIKGEYYEKVYFWDHDWGNEGDEPVTYDNLSIIANNFSDFIDMLYDGYINHHQDTRIFVNIHDKYSWPFSIEVRQHGLVITDFFAKAPEEVKDYIIEEVEKTKDVILKYTVKSEDKQYIKHLDKQGKMVKQLVLGSSEDYPPL